ncbi:hypothetical protein L2X99_12045 [Microbacterium sp. KUDC0406]|uniref:hypothetical protein n=1 Tax=Microbacterium sp. KUDC0406 TaxID=2909588 RepID=UPI001F44C855|nr:hypothetical protein [Microbacterium sp. KUDC0406]UJP09174.1 hypothetical protein L2X99_12045 [Microbacterium sp. KUDC0406]
MSDEEPGGFSILFPPGWSRYFVDDEGRKALTARMSAQIRALGRPDLDLEARMLINQQWKQLQTRRVGAVYLPDAPVAEDSAPLPMSFALIQHRARPGVDFESSFRDMAHGRLESFDTVIGRVLRAESERRGKDELKEVIGRQVDYGIPLPIPGDGRGMIVSASITTLDDTDPNLVAGLVELADTIVETFRWRA